LFNFDILFGTKMIFLAPLWGRGKQEKSFSDWLFELKLKTERYDFT